MDLDWYPPIAVQSSMSQHTRRKMPIPGRTKLGIPLILALVAHSNEYQPTVSVLELESDIFYVKTT